MDFDLSDDQRLLADSVTRLMADRYGFEARKGYLKDPAGWSPAMWAHYAGLGLLGLPFAEEHGGYGGGPVDVMLVMQEFGRALALEPYLATVVLGGTALQLAGSAAQQASVLPAVAEGRVKLAFAHGEREARYDLPFVRTTAKRSAGGWVLDGAKSVVFHGDSADRLVVSARVAGDDADPEGIGLFLVDADAAGLARRGYTLRDETRAAEIALHDVAAEPLGEPGAAFPVITRVVEAGIAAMGAEAVGAMEAMHAMTLEYSRTREQFGKPIGANQVVQHRLAEMLMSMEQGRSMAMLAAMSVTEPDAAERARSIAMAKVGYGQAARFVSQQTIQLHGGIGMTEEYAAGHFFRRCLVIEHSFGDTAYHLARLADEVE